jgi:hypothetical protein
MFPTIRELSTGERRYFRRYRVFTHHEQPGRPAERDDKKDADSGAPL